MIISELTTMAAEWDKVPDFLYFGTYSDLLPRIAEYGLGNLGGRTRNYANELYNGNGIFLAVTPESALEYACGLRNIDVKDAVIMQIPKKALRKDFLWYDFNDYETVIYVYGGCENSSIERTYFYSGIISNPQVTVKLIDFD